MTMAADAYRTLVRAVAPLDARVLITVGPAVDVATLGPVPDHVHVEQWVDQSRVLPEAAAVVCHGGSGTTYGALATGCPVVIVPLFADQFANARAVAGSGAGLAVGDERAAERGRLDLTDGLAARLTGAVEIRPRHTVVPLPGPAHRRRHGRRARCDRAARRSRRPLAERLVPHAAADRVRACRPPSPPPSADSAPSRTRRLRPG